MNGQSHSIDSYILATLIGQPLHIKERKGLVNFALQFVNILPLFSWLNNHK